MQKQQLFIALSKSPDEVTANGILEQLYRICRLEGFDLAGVNDPVTPDEASRRMGKWLKEQYYFYMFGEHYPLPEGEIRYGDKPDFILQGERKIGIETTNFYLEDGALPASEQVQRKLRNKVVSEAERIYSQSGDKAVPLSFSFDKTRPIRDRKKLANNMSELARRVAGLPPGPIKKNLFEEIPELEFVYLTTRQFDDSRWQVINAHEGQIMSRERLQAIVCSKEALSKDYESCDAFWLVVVVDFIDPAQDQEIRFDRFEKIDSSIFEKVIVYKTAFHHIIRGEVRKIESVMSLC